MILPIKEPRCLAYDVPHQVRKKTPEWCARRDTCARALALRSDPPNAAGRVIEYRVCAVGHEDAFVASDVAETAGGPQ
jgi:hypothetical protein